jgi:hypothetical protein
MILDAFFHEVEYTGHTCIWMKDLAVQPVYSTPLHSPIRHAYSRSLLSERFIHAK